MKLQLRTYRVITSVCLGTAVLCAILFDKLPPSYQLPTITIAITAALVSAGTHFYNLGFFEKGPKVKSG